MVKIEIRKLTVTSDTIKWRLHKHAGIMKVGKSIGLFFSAIRDNIIAKQHLGNQADRLAWSCCSSGSLVTA